MDSIDIIGRGPAFAVLHVPPGGLETGGANLQITANRRASAIALLVAAAQLPAGRAGRAGQTADVWKDACADYPPTGAATRLGHTGLTGWTSGIATGDFPDCHVGSARTVRHGSVVPTVAVS